MLRDVRVHLQLGADALRERLGGIRIAVHDEDLLWRAALATGAAEVGEPGLEFVLVGMGAETGDRAHATANVDLLAVDARRLPAVLDVAAKRALALVADEEQRALRIGEEVLEVVHDPPAGEHA